MDWDKGGYFAQSFQEVTAPPAPLTRRGRRPEYHDDALIELVYRCWLGRERMCAKRLVVQLESWLEEHEAHFGEVETGVRERFLKVSAATIDRILKPKRDAWYQRSTKFGSSSDSLSTED